MGTKTTKKRGGRKSGKPSYHDLCFDVWLPRPIHSKAEYGRALKAMESVMTNRPSADELTYLDLVAQLIETYEQTLVAPPKDLEPAELLRHLCELHDLGPSDLSRLLGDRHRAIGGRLLRGERTPSKRQAQILADHFKLEVSAFI